jgi:aspartokinase-like uncharacterized kinase
MTATSANASWQHGTIRRRSRGTAISGPLVIKVGGSLLGRIDWPRLVGDLVREAAGDRGCLLVVGGGAVVESLRSSDAERPLPPEQTHRAAIDVMGATGWLVARLLGLPLVAEPPRPPGHEPAVLDAPAWLGRDGRLEQLPVGWDVTSDAIAACVAASEGYGLLLAKSVPPPVMGEGDCQALAGHGWIDRYFPRAAESLEEIAWACPRSVPPPVVGGPRGEGGGSPNVVG